MLFPITMVGRLSECLLLSFRVRADALEDAVPRGLALHRVRTRGGEEWGFVNVVVCRVAGMRPRGVPRWLGLSYWHVAYRIVVLAPVAHPNGGVAAIEGVGAVSVGGLYFLRSDADSSVVRGPGNLLSDFRFHRSRVEVDESGPRLTVEVRSSDRAADATLAVDLLGEVRLPEGSIFESMDQARALLKYHPLSLAPGRAGWARMATIRRDERWWRERAVRVERWRFAYLDRFRAGGLALELCTRVAPIDYRWTLGKRLRVATGFEPGVMAL